MNKETYADFYFRDENYNSSEAGSSETMIHFGEVTKVYVVIEPGILTCADLQDGKTDWKLRLEGPFTATPVATAERMYLVNEAGLCQVVKLGAEQGEELAKNQLKLGQREPAESILATPSISGDALFIRSDSFLWKIAH